MHNIFSSVLRDFLVEGPLHCVQSFLCYFTAVDSNQKNVAVTIFRPMDVHSASWLLNEMLVMQFLNLQKENRNVGPFC
jgi:hypothetical protein